MKDTILKNKSKQYGYLIAILLVPISFLLDGIVKKLILRIHNPFFDVIFSYFSNITLIVGFLIIIAVAMLSIKKDHKWILAMFSSIIFTGIIIYYLKFFIARPRPSGIELIFLFNLIDYSFPSFHSALLFSVIPVLDKSFSHHKFLWGFIGVIIGLSRLYLGVHYFSDVIYGAFIGLIIGEIILLIEKKYGWFTCLEKLIWK